MKSNKINLKDVVLFILLSSFWGGSFVAIKFMVQDVPPITGAFFRVFFAIFFTIIFTFKKLKIVRAPLKEFGRSIVASCFSIAFPFALLYIGEMSVSAGLAGILNSTVPLWSYVIALVFFKGTENLSLSKSFGLVLGFLGIVIIFYPRLTYSKDIIAPMMILSMALCYAIGANLNKRVLKLNLKVTGSYNIVIQLFSASVFLFIIALFREGVPYLGIITSRESVLSLFYLSCFSSSLAFIIFYHLIEKWGAVRASTVAFFMPIFATIFDILFFKHLPNIYEILGLMIILSSINFLRKG